MTTPSIPPYAERPLVIIESPFAAEDGEVLAENIEYARRAVLDSLRRGEAPFASHLLYTQVLDDRLETERHQGIEAGLSIKRFATKTVVYTDRGISPGMSKGIEFAVMLKQPVEYRTLPPEVTIPESLPVTVKWKNP